jgi:two-component system sensor histidine kinase TctE
VTVHLIAMEDRIELTVVDNGPGLTQAECEQLLARGTQGIAGQAMRQGAGFGLSIVTRYAQLLGATFWLQNVPHQQGLEAHVVFVNLRTAATLGAINTERG